MTRFFLVFLLSSTLTIASENSVLPDVESQIRELSAAREQWRARDPKQSYSFNYVRNCYCPLFGRTIRVEVEFGQIVSFQIVEDLDSSVEKEQFADLIRTIPDLFDEVLKLIEKNIAAGTVLEVKYDEAFGHPSHIKWRNPNDAHSDFALEVSNVAFK